MPPFLQTKICLIRRANGLLRCSQSSDLRRKLEMRMSRMNALEIRHGLPLTLLREHGRIHLHGEWASLVAHSLNPRFLVEEASPVLMVMKISRHNRLQQTKTASLRWTPIYPLPQPSKPRSNRNINSPTPILAPPNPRISFPHNQEEMSFRRIVSILILVSVPHAVCLM